MLNKLAHDRRTTIEQDRRGVRAQQQRRVVIGRRMRHCAADAKKYDLGHE